MKFLNLIHLSVKASKFFPVLVLGSISAQLFAKIPVQAQVTASSPVCGTKAPSGKVVTGYFYSQSCRPSWSWDISFTPNASVVKTPVSGMTICGSQAPVGYRVTRSTYSNQCDIWFNISRRNNAVVITKN
ncbi:hypothetical protein SR1949_04940 [Sphaerospermopsis reniformis]|uniref:Uncharacterized protein n=1 Tax=Sphaerospermopsis reniformis TaxID=531300 RepID=A0A479ZRR5_9CYAN|nr:hypothetical protein [Sphaerospermopsis reniformis]GCL35400.1 hypothetical protein SR1949_04940 [Sphaerospermopsis reniformis]